MAAFSYTLLQAEIQKHWERGLQISERDAGTPANEIRAWVGQSEYYLTLLQDRLGSALTDFRLLKPQLEFAVDDEDEGHVSHSAYRPSWGDVNSNETHGLDRLFDFRFDVIAQMNGLLRLALEKLELDRNDQQHSEASPESAPQHPSVPSQDREDQTYSLDASRLRQSRDAIGWSQKSAAAWFDVSERQYKRWESGTQKRMKPDNKHRYRALVRWAEAGNTGAPPDVT